MKIWRILDSLFDSLISLKNIDVPDFFFRWGVKLRIPKILLQGGPGGPGGKQGVNQILGGRGSHMGSF